MATGPISDPAVLIVNDKYAQSLNLANQAAGRLTTATDAFNKAVYSLSLIHI